MTKIRLVALLGLTVVATYVVAEWSVLHKSGLHDLRAAEPVELLSVPVEPERLALQAQVDRLERTFGDYRAVKERQIADLLKLIANLERQIQVLTAQRAPMEQVAALRAASQPVRWQEVTIPAPLKSAVPDVQIRWKSSAGSASVDLAKLAREVGFTRVEVRR